MMTWSQGEATSAATSSSDPTPPLAISERLADLAYHLLVLLAERGIDLNDVEAELDRRTSSRSR